MKSKSFGYEQYVLEFCSKIEQPGMNQQEVVSIVLGRDNYNCPKYTVFYRAGNSYKQ